MPKRASLFDYIVLLRPDLIILTLASILFGYYKGLATSSKYIIEGFSFQDTPILSYPTSSILVFLGYVLLACSTYILNQIIDFESDKLNNKGLMIAVGRVPKKDAILISFFVFITGFLIILSFRSLILLFLAAITVFLGLVYSLPPIQLKGKPFLDLLCNALAYGFVAFSQGWVLTNEFGLNFLFFATPFVLICASIYAASAIPDMEGDKQSGVITIAVFLGRKNTLLVAQIFALLSLIFSYFLQDINILIPSFLSSALYLWAWHSPKPNNIKNAYRISGFLVTLFILLPHPYFLIALLVFYLTWRVLYRDFIH